MYKHTKKLVQKRQSVINVFLLRDLSYSYVYQIRVRRNAGDINKQFYLSRLPGAGRLTVIHCSSSAKKRNVLDQCPSLVSESCRRCCTKIGPCDSPKSPSFLTYNIHSSEQVKRRNKQQKRLPLAHNTNNPCFR